MRDAEARALAESGLGSGLLAAQPAPAEAESVAVLKVCPLCGNEYETAARFCPSDGTALRPKGTDSLIDRVLADRYHILKRIGEGGMGRVYLGEHVKMNRQCAIKVMSPALVNDAESASRFAREASNAARIIHPNVAAVFDYGESEGLVYLVMEYVDGEPLSRLLTREAPLSLERALNLASQIADGLGAAHELGIVHRDLKPDNILVMRTRAGREVAKVVDFGIAKAIQEGAAEGLTRTGQVIGTPEFMSPEQLLGDPVDARSDLYALGCILHLMLTAAPPLQAATREQMIKRRLSEDAAPVRSLDPGIPETVARIVARLLTRSPKERYGSAAEVRDALAGTHRRTGMTQGKGGDERPTPRSAPTVAFIQATRATTEVIVVPADKPIRKVAKIAGGVVVVAAVIAGGVYVSNRPDAIEAERFASVQDSIRGAEIAIVPIDTLPGGAPLDAPGTPVVGAVSMTDTAAQARRAAKATADSIANVRRRESAAVRAPLVRYVQAIESGSIESLRAVDPAMTPAQIASWEQNVFARAEQISASVTYGATSVVGDSADVDFRLQLKVVLKNAQGTSNFPMNRHAKLVRQGSAWQLVTVR